MGVGWVRQRCHLRFCKGFVPSKGEESSGEAGLDFTWGNVKNHCCLGARLRTSLKVESVAIALSCWSELNLMQSVRSVINVMITIFLLAFIGLNLFRLAVFVLSSQHLI